MKKRLPPWCKLVKHTLIDKDMDVSELATKTGLARPYLSSIINGRIYSQPAVNKVSDCLGISNDYDAIYQPANSIGQSEEKSRVEEDFKKLVLTVYGVAKNEGILRYNDVRPLITAIDGVEDFDTFLINGKMSNIKLEKEEYPVTGTIDFRS